jgi:hypothetical protein
VDPARHDDAFNRHRWATFGALQGRVQHGPEQFRRVMQALRRETEIARAAYELTAAVGHSLIACRLDGGAFGECAQCLFRDAAATA